MKKCCVRFRNGNMLCQVIRFTAGKHDTGDNATLVENKFDPALLYVQQQLLSLAVAMKV